MPGVCAHHGVFDAQDVLAFDQALQAFEVDVLLALDVERDRHAGDLDKALDTVGHALRGGESLHGQDHGGAVARALEDLCLLDHLAEVRADGRDHAGLRACCGGQHLQQGRVFMQGQVVHVGVAAVQQSGDAACLDVTDELLVGRSVDGQVCMTGQRRNGQNGTGKLFKREGRGFHGQVGRGNKKQLKL